MKSEEFIEKALETKIGTLSPDGALMVKTGASTGRSPKERFVVRHPEMENEIDWSSFNQPIDVAFASNYFSKLEQKINAGDSSEINEYIGCFKVKVKSLSPWHLAFAKNMFRESFIESLKSQIKDDIEIQILHDPYGSVKDLGIEWKGDKAIIVDPLNLKVGIIGTAYAGEVKKSAFGLCNFLLPKYGIMPMHSSANCTSEGTNSSILFGLSGTGKTTLSADPKRGLIGDDEIIWSNKGVSNLEGGCYAKLINLSKEDEPEIYSAANRSGSILENVVFNEETKKIDFCDSKYTENTRASYDIKALSNVYDQNKEAEHPKSIIFLTADAFGGLPAVAKLDEWQAQYHFISGYTAKVAGTEIGVVEPEATFSACFGAPFMPRPAGVYGELLAKLIKEHNVSVWLLNTGWVKGYGNSDRFPIPVSRALLTAIQSGSLNDVEMKKHPVFGFQVPVEVPGVDKQWFEVPEGPQVMALAKKFMANAEANSKTISKEVIEKGGPMIWS